MDLKRLESVARQLVTEGKGILAADESSGTIKKRFDAIGVESTGENRRAYRELLFTTGGMEEFISGVILFDETIRQKAADGTPFPEVLDRKGVVPGIKVDKGGKQLAFSPKEKVTEGLDGLRDRLVEYRELGARFAKWRAVISIEGSQIPTRNCLRVNAQALARYAALCQDEDVTPIVEPEVLMDGDNDIAQCECVTEGALRIVFEELYDQGVRFEGMLLKPNMVIAGKKAAQQAGVEEVADRTIRCMRRVVPSAVPGIVFLSGGQSAELATDHLNAMNRMGPHPWELSFSYGRALQEPSQKAWQGNPDNVKRAQELFYHRARCNGLARRGKYSPEVEKQAA